VVYCLYTLEMICMNNFDIVWHQCLEQLNKKIKDSGHHNWIKSLTPKYVDGKIHIFADNMFVFDFINDNYWQDIKNIINQSTNSKFEIVLSLMTKAERPSPTKQKTQQPEVNEVLHHATKLNSNYTFDTLVRGNSNQIAYAIGIHITQSIGLKTHNPLFIYGGVGLGKTHLVQAIGNELYKHNSNAKIRYLHANDYINDVVKASMNQGFDALKKYYNNLDLLLMDDIQFIAGDKTKTQEEFFYTFNALIEKNKQVIMTCDTYPKNINNLNARLVSRFASGLTVEIQPPELEMRVAILKRKAMQIKLNLNDDVAFFIAQHVKSNVRELEGALNRVAYQAHFADVDTIDLAIAKEALMDIFALDSRNISIDDIQKTICEFYKISMADLLSTKRKQNIVKPRQIAMSLAKDLTQSSLPSIGRAFGGRDHSTVIHAKKTIDNLCKLDSKIQYEYKLLVQMLNK
jgi:chromosomal replication initiator protein